MNNGNELGLTFFQSHSDLLRLDDFSPFRFDLRDFRAATFRDIAHAGAKNAVHADDYFVAGFEEIHEAKFHSPAAVTAKLKFLFFSRLKNLAKHTLNFVHHYNKNQTKRAEQRRCHPQQNGRRDVTGAKSDQQTFRRLKPSKIL